MTFKEQYTHPNWQKKRLEKLNESRFSCESCGTSDKQLHVHHCRYIKGRKIWEYETHELDVLCEGCHKEAHILKSTIEDAIFCDPNLDKVYLYGLLKGMTAPLFLNSSCAFQTHNIESELSGMIGGKLLDINTPSIYEAVLNDIKHNNLDEYGDPKSLVEVVGIINLAIKYWQKGQLNG